MMNQQRKQVLPDDGAHDGSRPERAPEGDDAKWDIMWKKLKAFHQVHGHSNVPSRYPDDPALGFWVSTQRRQFRKLMGGSQLECQQSALHPERKRKLDQLQFQFSAKDPNSLSWEARYTQLKEFVKKYGHALVPIKWKQNSQLASWVSRQRQEYRQRIKGLPSRLNDERMALLTDLGFVWEPKRGAPRREEQLKELPPAPATEASISQAQQVHSTRTTSPSGTEIGAFVLPSSHAHGLATAAGGGETPSSPSAKSELMMTVLGERPSRTGAASTTFRSAAAFQAGNGGILPSSRPTSLQLLQPETLLLPMSSTRQGLASSRILRATETPSLEDRLLHAAFSDRISQLAARELRLGAANSQALSRADRLLATSSILSTASSTPNSLVSPSLVASASSTSVPASTAASALSMSNLSGGVLNRNTSATTAFLPVSGRSVAAAAAAAAPSLPSSIGGILPVSRLPALPAPQLRATSVASLPPSTRAASLLSTSTSRGTTLPVTTTSSTDELALSPSSQLGTAATSQELALLRRIREELQSSNPTPPFF